MPLMKLCSYRGCTKIIQDGVTYCDYHQKKFDINEKERYKVYSKKRMQDAEQKRHQSFYNSDDWKRIRDAIIANCFSIDIIEFFRTGALVEGFTVHHIIPIEDNWNSRFNIDNLIYVSESNHQRIHMEYLKGQREKEQMQKILFDLKQKWNDAFAI